MRILLILLLICLVSSKIEAQQVFASTGKDAANSTVKISYTIGEPLVSKINNASVSLSNGFQNATNLTITAIRNNLFSKNEFLVYPNPTQSNLIIENKSNNNNFLFRLYTINGNEILLADFNNLSKQSIDINSISSGIYILEIKDKESEESQSYKIEKINK